MINHAIHSSKKILLLEACNFTNVPLGGQLTAACMLMQAFGPRLILAGWTDDPQAPIGKWSRRVINGVEYDFFATDFVDKQCHKRPFFPARARSWRLFKKYGREILSHGTRNILTQEPTVMMALPFTHMHNVAFWFPGTGPTLAVSRYPGAKHFATLFDWYLTRKLGQHCRSILAAADEEAILQLRERSKRHLERCKIQFFPTRVDTGVFKPKGTHAAKQELMLPKDMVLVVTTGRLHRAKGWPLLLEAMENFCRNRKNALLVFVGDGGDRFALEEAIVEKGLNDHVFLAGQQPRNRLAIYLQAADLFIMGSEQEGWSTSLIEALATGLPIVTTPFSSANSIVKQGVNGFVVARDARQFANAMVDALELSGVLDYSRSETEKYALANLDKDLESVWELQ